MEDKELTQEDIEKMLKDAKEQKLMIIDEGLWKKDGR